MKLDMKQVAAATARTDAEKRAAGLLPELAAPKSTRTLDEVKAQIATLAAGGWYCLRVDPSRQDKIVIDEKTEKEKTIYLGKMTDAFALIGAQVYFPLGKQKKNVRHHGKLRTVERMLPAFPGYIFAGFDVPVDWIAVKEITGVLSVIGNSIGEPRRLSEAEIESIRGKEQRGEYAYNWKGPKAPRRQRFAIVQNDHVEIKGGALARYTGVVRRTFNHSAELEPDLFPGTVVHIPIAELRVIP